jgi:hypothetical protein
MRHAGPSRLSLLLPSMTDVAFIMPLVYLFCGMKGAQTLLSDGDTGWHLRTGEWILAHGRVPDHDIFSFTRAGQPWFAWEWLWDVVFGWLNREAGMPAVILGCSLLLALTFALLFRLARRHSDALAALAMTLLAAAASAGHWLARPHLVTLLFVVIFFSVLERGDGRRLWVLPALMVLWTNLHGGFLAGILLVGVYAAGEFAVLLRGAAPDERSHACRRGWRYVWTAAVCGLATFVNPYFYRLHLHIFHYLTDGFYSANIMEFQSLNFQSAQARYLELLLAAGAAAAFIRLRRMDVTWPLLFALWAHLALYSARHVEIFVLLAAAPSAEMLSLVFDQAPAWRWTPRLRLPIAAARDFLQDWNCFDRGPHWPVASVAGAAMLAALLYAPHPPAGCRAVHDPKAFPVAAAGELERAGLLRGVFTPDLWGGYLIYRQYPRGRVFIDGRSDFYGPDFAGRYIKAMGAQSGWEQYFNHYAVETVLLPPDTPLTGALKQSGEWRLIYDDGVALIFRSVLAPEIRLSAAAAVPSGNGDASAGNYHKENQL